MKITYIACLLTSVSLTHEAMAGSPKVIVPPEPASRWSVSAGAAVSSIKTSFNANGTLLPAFRTGTSSGSTNLYNGGANPEVYQNGSVGLVGTTDPINAITGFSGGSVAAVQTGLRGATLSQATFNSSSTAGSSSSGGDTDRNISTGAYIRLEYLLQDWASSSLSLFGQYTFTTAFNSGLPSATGSTTTTNQTFTYDVYGGFRTPINGLVYNATTYNGLNAGNVGALGLRNAQAPTTQSTQTRTSSVTLVPERINIYMHTIALGVAYKKDLGSRAKLVVSTGPTLNLFDYNFTTPGVASVNGTATSYATAQSNSGQTLRFGWIGQVGVTLDLDSQKLYYLEVAGDYHWVDGFTASTGLGTARTDASSWGVNVGIGRRF